MKRFWLVLLSLGLIVAFSTSAMAVDVKFSGEFYVAGLYLDKTTLVQDPLGTNTVYTKTLIPTPPGPQTIPGLGTTAYFWNVSHPAYTHDVSTAFYFQRLRLNTTFIVSPGLTLTTRADIMERAWGANRTAPGTTADLMSAGTTAENENIAFDLAYVTYVSPIGAFLAGYVIDGAWGCVWGDTSQPTPRITYLLPIGGFQFSLMAGKNPGGELNKTAKNPLVAASDTDDSFYTAFVKYLWKDGEAGVLAKTFTLNSARTAIFTTPPSPALGYLALDVPWDHSTRATAVIPYMKAKFGPVSIQAEFDYAWGKYYFEGPYANLMSKLFLTEDQLKIQNMSAWVDAVADFGIAYVGATAAYVSGDDPGTKDKAEGGLLTGGQDYNPCLIMFNSDLNYWAGSIAGYTQGQTAGAAGGNVATLSAPMTNLWFFQGRAGVRPINNLDIMASVSFANADKKPTAQWLYNDYGWEVDLTATYKITNNLSYMLGAGYLFTGKYFKADLDINKVTNDYMLINKLTLTF